MLKFTKNGEISEYSDAVLLDMYEYFYEHLNYKYDVLRSGQDQEICDLLTKRGVVTGWDDPILKSIRDKIDKQYASSKEESKPNNSNSVEERARSYRNGLKTYDISQYSNNQVIEMYQIFEYMATKGETKEEKEEFEGLKQKAKEEMKNRGMDPEDYRM